VLAERLREGPLPLSTALECLTDVAQSLRTLHAAGRWHGQIGAQSVEIEGERYTLTFPPRACGWPIDFSEDVKALGALMFEVVTGARPVPGAPLPAVPRVVAMGSDPVVIRAAALRIATRCLNVPRSGQTIGKTAVELRMLSMLARQTQRRGKRLTREMGGAQAGTAPVRVGALAVDGARKGSENEPAGDWFPAEPPELPGYRHCPVCDSSDVHRSTPCTGRERFAAVGLRIPLYRCHRCYHRWFLFLFLRVACRVRRIYRPAL
jgi:hypothetical protein